jgi:hypothetical protein
MSVTSNDSIAQVHKESYSTVTPNQRARAKGSFRKWMHKRSIDYEKGISIKAVMNSAVLTTMARPACRLGPSPCTTFFSELSGLQRLYIAHLGRVQK